MRKHPSHELHSMNRTSHNGCSIPLLDIHPLLQAGMAILARAYKLVSLCLPGEPLNVETYDYYTVLEG